MIFTDNIKEQIRSRTFRTITLFTFTLAIMFAAGCSESATSTENDTNGDDDPAPAADVTMEGISFLPDELTVDVGTTVTWSNESSVIHTVTSGTDGTHDGIFDSGNLSPDEEFSYTFDEAGTYPYYCIPHVNQGMTGTIIVQAAD